MNVDNISEVSLLNYYYDLLTFSRQCDFKSLFSDVGVLA